MSVQEALADEVRVMLTESDAREAWARLGLVTTSSTPAEIRAALRREHDFWGPIVKSSGFTPET